ncbi:MAG: hypothetical protein JO130_10315 [Solirubrobacterales bacterium]|nr:hypothetical protein [Solirubrobacterales bacterium]
MRSDLNQMVASVPSKASSVSAKAKPDSIGFGRSILFGRRGLSSSGAGVARAFPFRSRLSGTASSITVYVGQHSDARTLLVGLYSSVRGRPGVRLTVGSIGPVEPGAWNSARVRRVAVNARTIYWLVVLGKGGGVELRHGRSTSCVKPVSYELTLTAMPSAWTGGTPTRLCRIAAYVQGTARAVHNHGAPTGFELIGAAGSALMNGFGGTGRGGTGGGVLPPVGVTNQPIVVPPSENCLSQLRSGGGTPYPVWSSVIACHYPAPTSLDPNGASSGGTAGVPDGTTLQNASTCGCLPAGDSWNSSGGYLSIDGTGTVSNLYVPGSVYIGTSSPVTIQDSDIEVAPGGSGYAVDGNGDSGVTLTHSWIHTRYSGQACTQSTSYSSADVGVGNFGSVTLQDDDVDCFPIPLENSNLTVSGSVIVSDGTVQSGHYEPIYTGHDDQIVGNTIINPQTETAEVFGDEDCSGCSTLTNVTIENSLLAGNQNNGGLALGCTAGNGFQADFGHGPNANVIVLNNRFSNAYNLYRNAPFSAGNTDGQSGTIWTGNYMDNNLATVAEPAQPC